MTVRVTTLKGAGAGEYYTREVRRELEVGSYYTREEEPPGQWIGAQADDLGLHDDVEPAQFLQLMAGLDPNTGKQLGRVYGESSARGYDITFNAPKSVSLLAEFADDQVRAHVLAAHDVAVGRVLGFVEAQAHTRVTVQQVTSVVDTQGLCVAGFRQHTSRAGDPHVHTHAVVIAKVQDERGRWFALDARMIKHDQRTLSALYHSSLRTELTRSLGVQWRTPDNGIAELAGMSDEVLSRFSTRTDQLEQRLQDKLDRFRATFEREPTDKERWRLEREAAVDSRPTKASVPRADELSVVWRRELGDLGLTPEELSAEVIGRHLTPTGITAQQVAQIVTAAQLELFETGSTWRRNDVIREIARLVPTDVNSRSDELMGWIERTADAVLERHVELAPRIAANTPIRSDGRPITESTMDRRFTTSTILAQEEYLATWAFERFGLPGQPASLDVEGLDRAQAFAARAGAGTDALVVIVGPAGAGKTTALRSAVNGLAGAGRPVFGVAPSATAAAVLAKQTGVAADTVDKLLHEHTRPDRPPDSRFNLPPGATVLVDEASMISTPKLAQLAALADRQQWRVVLIGDPQQLAAVGRSGMFAHLVDTGQVIELDRIHRFTQPWERTASIELRRGNSDAFDDYQANGRLHDGTRIDMQRAALKAWTEHRGDGGRAVMLAVTNDTVHKLNDAAQAVRVRGGEIDWDHCVPGPDCWVHVGDEIVTRTNDRTLRTDHDVMVRNRAQWTVTDIHGDGSVTARNADGTVRLPAAYVSTSVELGYAQTVHGAQGATVDHSLLIVDAPIDGRALYVGMTRGAESNHVYVAVGAYHDGRDILDAAIDNDWADIPAIEIRAELATRPLTPFAPPLREAAAVGMEAEGLRAMHTEQRGLRALDLPGHEQRLERLEAQDSADRRQLQQAHTQRDKLTSQLATITARRAMLPAFGHKTERHDLDRNIKQLQQQRLIAGRDAAAVEQRIEQRAADLVAERRWAAEHTGLDARQRELDRALSLDAGIRGHAATQDPPSYLTNSLGPVPDEPGQRIEWERLAGRVEQHREIHGITDPDRPLGPHLEWNDISDRGIEQQHLERQAQQIQQRGLGHDLAPHHGPVLEL